VPIRESGIPKSGPGCTACGCFAVGGAWVWWQRQWAPTGRRPLLRPEEESQVSDTVATGRFRTAWEIQDWIAQQYGASYTLGGVYSLLKRLKRASKVSRRVHAKTNRPVQATWKRGKGTRHGGGQNKGGSRVPERVGGEAGAGVLPHLVRLD
jgi:Winged helix-turn helix